MKVEYIGQSGVLVELEHMNLLFDCIAPVSGYEPAAEHDTGRMPQLAPDKQLVVFVSHSHGDHYSEHIWELENFVTNVDYVLSSDVGIAEGVSGRITTFKNHQISEVKLKGGSSIRVQSIPATDQGVAYLVHADGRLIFHAGDHHMWLWDEEGEKYVRNMARAFRASIAHLEIPDGRAIDLAFLLLDPRLGDRAFEGMDAALEDLPVRNAVPIHQWRNYTITDDYLKSHGASLKELTKRDAVSHAAIDTAHAKTLVYKITGENCRFNI